MNAELPVVGILGLGRLGSSLECSLGALRHEVRVHRRGDILQDWLNACDVLCLSVRDDQIIGVVSELSVYDLGEKIALIHSGSVSLEVMRPLREAGAVVGKFHPLQAFTSMKAAPVPSGTPWAAEGPIDTLVRPWVDAWDGQLHFLTGDQWAVYHLAAVTAANFLPLFIRAGSNLLEPMSKDRQEALDWLAPLVRRSVEGALDAEKALPFSGPAVRGDRDVIAAQIELLEKLQPGMADLYRRASEEIGLKSQTTHKK